MSRQNPQARGPVLPLLLFGAGLLFILAAAIWAFQNNAAGGETGPQVLTNPNPAAVPLPGIARVNLEEAYAAYEQGEAVFVDVRDADSYAAGHIPGAVLIPESELAQRIGDLDPTKWVITYCT